MAGWIILLLVVAAAVGLYLFALAPGKDRRPSMKPFQSVYIAHRGLFDNKSDHPENSMKAFSRAVEEGYGIELDVQMTTDGQLVVFHDDTLKRMCGSKKMVTECSLQELSSQRLLKSQEKIPLLGDVLARIGGRVPLIVEIKSAGDWRTTTEKTAQMLDQYHGIYCVESFHPLIVAWFRRNRPHVIRGQLSTNLFRSKASRSPAENFLVTNLLTDFLARPDFIAYNHKYADQFSFRLLRRLFPVTAVAWTIKNQEQLEKAKKDFSVFIFDSFLPKSMDERL
ncbi:MAG: glycerophosphodiester phosphodiesterase [Lachnospiraceae bacterium]|nr:glycerophosphodiester phosphodiesterase [Lachnospiraceae bacterium]